MRGRRGNPKGVYQISMSKFESMIIGIGSSSATTSTDSGVTSSWKNYQLWSGDTVVFFLRYGAIYTELSTVE